MEAGKHSITALHAAFMRAHHDAHARPTIFADTYAYLMLTASEREAVESRLLDDLHRLDPARAASCPDRQTALAVAMWALPSPAHIIARARYAEDTLAEALPHGLRHYVIIGAGMDTFALRHPELYGRLHVVELDHPTTQAFFKIAVTSRLGCQGGRELNGGISANLLHGCEPCHLQR